MPCDLCNRGDAGGHLGSGEAFREDDMERLRHRHDCLDGPGRGRPRDRPIDQRAGARRRAEGSLVATAADRGDREPAEPAQQQEQDDQCDHAAARDLARVRTLRRPPRPRRNYASALAHAR